MSKKKTDIDDQHEFCATIKFFGGGVTKRSVLAVTKAEAEALIRSELSEDELRFVDDVVISHQG